MKNFKFFKLNFMLIFIITFSFSYLGFHNSENYTMVNEFVIKNNDGVLYQKGQINLKFKSQIFTFTNDKFGISGVDNLLQQYDVTQVIQPYPLKRDFKKWTIGDDDLAKIFRIKYESDIDPFELSEMLMKQNPDILKWVEPNFVYEADYTPNDPNVSDQYHIEIINAYQGWDINKGDTNIVIGIVDTGGDLDHPDLEDNIKINWDENPTNGIDDDGNGKIDDWRGWDFVGDGSGEDNNPQIVGSNCDHGSAVSGDASQVTDNNVHGAGVGFKVKLLISKHGDDDDYSAPGGNSYLYDTNDGIVYCYQNGAKVINCSFGSSSPNSITQDIVNNAWTAGAMVVGSAGNSGLNIARYPASYDNVVSVAATNSSDIKTSFSNYHSTVDVSAPGQSILSTLWDDTYASMNGTSMSAPITSGNIALIRSKYPSWTPSQVLDRVLLAVDSIYHLPGNSSYVGLLGTGRINTFKALSDLPIISLISVEHNDSIYGNDNNAYEIGEVIPVAVTYKNTWLAGDNVSLRLTTEDTDVEIVKDSIYVGSLEAYETYNSTLANAFEVRAKSTCPSNKEVTFKIWNFTTAYSDNNSNTFVIIFRTCSAISSFPYTQNFDSWTKSSPGGECTSNGSVTLESCWINSSSDDFDWDILNGSTWSSNTGPTGDHTSGSGKYLYTESTDCYYHTGYIFSPSFNLTSISPRLTFWYHMYGSNMGTMSLQASTNNGSSWSSDLWSLSGNQGNGWYRANVDLSSYSSQTGVMLRWTGLTGSSFTSDMAIDDIVISDHTPESGLWAGITSDWGTSSNWDDGNVPTTAVDVTIPEGYQYYPLINESAACNDIDVQSGGSLSMTISGSLNVSGNIDIDGTVNGGSQTITVEGNWNIDGTFNYETSSVVLNNTSKANQNLTGPTGADLTTTFASNNWWKSNYFDISATGGSDVTVNTYAINTYSTGSVSVEVWYRTDTYVGHTTDPAGWVQVGTTQTVTGQGTGNPTTVIPGASVTIPNGSKYGFFVSCYSGGTGYIRYINGANTYSDSYITIECGHSCGTSQPGYGNTSSYSRTWNGTVYYTSPDLSVLKFYNLTINTNGTATSSLDIHCYNNFTNSSDAVLDVGSNVLTVDATYTNNGEIKSENTETCPSSTNTSIDGPEGSDDALTFNPAADMSSTTVTTHAGVYHSQGTSGIKRWWDINPTTGQTCTITLKMRHEETTNITDWSTSEPWVWNGTSWTQNGTYSSHGSIGGIDTVTYTNFTVTGGKASNIITLSINDPLPVGLISFNASVNKNNITLNWTTAWELNNMLVSM